VGPETWEVAEILLHLAEVYFQKQKLSPTEAVLQRTLELCQQLLGDLDQRWIEVYHLQGKLSLELGRPVEAFQALEKALSLSRTHAEPLSRSLLIASGRASLLTERHGLALELLQKAEALFGDDISEWDTEAEEVVLIVGELCLGEGRYQDAEDRLTNVLAVQEQRFGFGDARLARVYRALGMAATGLGDLDVAEERLEIALAFQEEDLFSPLDLFEPFVAAVEAHRREGREERAGHLLIENLERCRDADRPEKVARLSALLARSQEARGDLKGAEEAWRGAIEAWEEAAAKVPLESRSRILAELQAPLQCLALLLSAGRRYTEAEELTKRRLKVSEMVEADEQDVANILFDLAELYRLQGLYREADELHQRVMATKASELGRTHPEVARSVRAIGQIALGEGKLEQAVTYLERALEHQVQSLGEGHPEVAETLFALGDTFLAKEQFRDSEDRYRRALEILEDHYGPRDIRTARGWTSLAGLYEHKQQWSRAQPLLDRAVESVEAVLGPSHLEVAELLMKSAEVYLVSGAWDEVSAPLERALEIRLQKLGEEHPAVARAYKLKGDLAMAMGDVAGARRLFSKADQIVSAYHGAESMERLPFRLALAVALRELDEFEQAHSHLTTLLTADFWHSYKNKDLAISDIQEELAKLELARGALPVAESFAKQTLEARSRLLDPQSEGVASALETLARIHRQDGRTITAAALAERALAARAGTEAGAEGKAVSILGRARVLTFLSRLELEQGGTAKATELATEALNLRRDLVGEDHPEVAATLHLLGEIAVAEKRLEKAESFFEQALERWERFFGVAHPLVFQAVTSMAQLYAQQGRLTLAEQFHQRNLVALEGRYGAEHPILADTLLGLGKLCRSQGNSAAAEKHLKRAAELQTAVYGESDPRVANVLHSLALVYQDQRNYLAAEALLKKAQQIRLKATSEETPELVESNLALARLYRSSGKTVEAEPLLKQVLDWRSKRFGDNHPEVASILREMAEVYADQKQYLKAQALVRRALDIYGAALGYRNLELVGPLRQLARLLEASGELEEAEAQRQMARELMGAG
jgi:tetratricopeptide (TPR) repeat protein